MKTKEKRLLTLLCLLVTGLLLAFAASAATYEVSDADDLLAVMRSIDSSGYIGSTDPVDGWAEGDTIRLMADVDLTSELPADHRAVIGSDDNQFLGTFDGNGHTITINTYVRSLFGNVGSTALIKDLTVEGTATGASSIGGIVGNMSGGTVQNCINKRAVTGTGTNVGGVVGNLVAGTISGCINRGVVTASGTWCGGIVGLAKSTGAGNLITGCVNEANITSTSTHFGGIVGYLISNPGSADIVGCINRGNVSSTKAYVGGIAGYIETKKGGVSVHLNDSANYGAITGLSYVGGITGYAQGSTGVLAYVDNCFNNGAVVSTSATISTADCGGISGILNVASVTNCLNRGSVTNNGGYKNVGGIIGRTANAADITTNCVNFGTVTTTNSQKGGVIGGITSSASTASNNYWLSTTAAKAYGTNNGDSDVSFTASQGADRDTFTALLVAGDKWMFSTELELSAFHTHTYDVTALVEIPATCTEAGSRTYNCLMCGDAAEEVIPALGHDYVVTTTAKAPTCTASGIGRYTCTRCEATKIDSIPATGHTEVEIPAVPATCTTNGATAGVKCAVCNEIFTAPTVIPATGHTEVEIPAVAATCTTDGATAGVRCSVCNAILTAPTVIPAFGHSEVALAAVPASCTESGLTAGVKCSVCNEILVAQEIIPALGHDYQITETYIEATCTEAGIAEYTCNRCGDTKYDDIPKVNPLSLSGVYTDGNGKLRFVTRVTTTAGDPDIEYFGTYIVPLSYFTEHELTAGGGEQPGVAAVKYTQSIENGASFAADLDGIPGAYVDTPIFAWSFVKFQGIDTIYTQVLGSFTVSGARLVKGGF